MHPIAIAYLLLATAAPSVAGSLSTPIVQDDHRAAQVNTEDPVGWLLSTASEAAALMPLKPHVKTRSRLQVAVVESALAVGRGEFASAQVPGIANWRRGLAQAKIAVHYAEAGNREKAEAALAEAQEIEKGITDEFDQGWRRDRVRVTMARVFALLGDTKTAAAIQLQAVPGEAGRLATLSTHAIQEEHLDQQIATLGEIAENGEMEQVKYALLSVAELYGRFYDSAERRASLEALIRDKWKAMPLEPRIEVLESLAAYDVAHNNLDHARAIADEVTVIVTGNRWNMEQSVAMHGRAADLLALSDQADKAHALLSEAMTLYGKLEPKIVSIYRGQALRPIAESYVKLGAEDAAVAIYQRALTEALVNPNSRPRAEDLVATCASIVESGLTPPRSLLRSVAQVRQNLGAPW